ncbi:hypothetical protein NDS46_30350 (plasmid) [Paenibacillus thiaminolyticus]|uniref:hypothetical protein n=1 Tax=Paenibacillus thiaminolyticus TaxID=49283 RepID=UPI00232FC5B1|nr:hypothetical protein [Paenibacillus thiaminolyticus]WCF11650.1 hypothetical protein NDS46_30350 [Paenibacillus thiaminolyticus]
MRNEVLSALARCRVAEATMLELGIGSCGSIIDSLLKDKFIKKKVMNYKAQDVNIYMLTDKGEGYIKNQMSEIKELYRGFVLEQDLALADFYFRRSKSERQTWITRDDFIKKYKLPGTVDGAFITEKGELQAVKVLSQNSGYEALKKVEDFLEQTEIPFIHYIVYS